MTTWRGIFREIERTAKRIDREIANQEKQKAQEEAIQYAENKIRQYEYLLNGAISLHKECCDPINWNFLSTKNLPKMIIRRNHFEEEALRNRKKYKASQLTKILRRTNKEIEKLDKEIQLGIDKDNEVYRKELIDYQNALEISKVEKNLASEVIKKELTAIKEVINSKFTLTTNPFIGRSINIDFDDDGKIFSYLYIHHIDEIIPTIELNQLKSGNLSKREMPKSKRFGLYKEYVCSAVLRLAREIFAILPYEEIRIDAKCNILNKRTGYLEEKIILSILIPRKTLDGLNIIYIEPSKAIANFLHNIDYKKLTGFKPVNIVTLY